MGAVCGGSGVWECVWGVGVVGGGWKRCGSVCVWWEGGYSIIIHVLKELIIQIKTESA